jgi:hypothetical protein
MTSALHELRGTIARLEDGTKAKTSTSVGPVTGSGVGVVPMRQEAIDIMVGHTSSDASQSKLLFDS